MCADMPAALACAGLVLDLDSATRPGYPMRTREREWNSPNTLRSHNTTPMTTTAFKIDLMLPAMGMNWFTSHKRTPTTTRTRRIWRRGMLFTFLSLLRDTSTPAQEFMRNVWAKVTNHQVSDDMAWDGYCGSAA